MKRCVPVTNKVNNRAYLYVISVSVLLTACSHHPPAPVLDLSKQGHSLDQKYSISRSLDIPNSYQVKPGDTLYSIAWDYGLDYKKIAQINALENYRIYPGQTLRLRFGPKRSSQPFDAARLRAAILAEVIGRKQVVDGNKKAGKEINRQPVRQASKRVLQDKRRHSQARAGAMTAPIKQWIWPVQGKVINKFESKGIGNRGLDIAGRRGEPVRAAASGRVVYSGEGLRGYGRLIIIKHNDDFLSAYAHNDKIFVKENELVKAGQKIASMGSSGAERTKLHFEIRLRGKPVDPLNYLPPI